MKQSTRDTLRSTNTAMALSRVETFISLWMAAHYLRMQSWPAPSREFINGSISVIEKECLRTFESAFFGMQHIRESIKDDLVHYVPRETITEEGDMSTTTTYDVGSNTTAKAMQASSDGPVFAILLGLQVSP